jgi:cytochrome P450
MGVFVEFLTDNVWSVFSAIVIGIVTVIFIYIAKFYAKTREYPSGPFPIPFIGTLYLNQIFKKDISLFQFITESRDKYGAVFTHWNATTAQVFVTDPKVIRDTLHKHQFAGRPQKLDIFNLLREDGENIKSTDVVTSDFSSEWEVLRKVTHSALRKYAVSDKLAILVSQVVDEVYDHIVEQHGDKSFDVKEKLQVVLLSVLSSSAFGKKYRLDDPELLEWKDKTNESQKLFLNKRFLLLFFFPSLRHIFRKSFCTLRDTILFQKNFMKLKFHEHMKDFDKQNIRDFTDALLMSRREAEEEDSKNLEYLHDQNIINSVLLLFSAGSETSRVALSWAFLILANDYEAQKKIRHEVETEIGLADIPTLQHKNRCHYTSAFVNEVLRFKPVAPLGVTHKTLVDTEVDGKTLKADTAVLFSLQDCLHDKSIWNDPEVFKPERFLDESGNFVSKPNQFYLPFSAGRRSCPGNKMALNVIFYIIARFIQKTHGMRIELENGVGSVDMRGNIKTGGILPQEYKVKFVKTQ